MVESVIWAGLTSALSAFVLVGIVRTLALRHGVLDHPTERSSHDVATARGGGLGLLLPALGLSAWRAMHPPYPPLLVTLVGAAFVAFVGWMDDRASLSVRARLTVHVMAALGVGSLALTRSPTVLIGAGVFLWWTFWTVSSINLVNFMDGINGLVASQFAVFAFSIAFFPACTFPSGRYYSLVFAAACVGFLPWNFPRARIFLGDVGSGSLGYMVPVLALLSMQACGIDFIRAHLPLLPLFGDAVWTFLRRWRKGERLTQAHRSHLYQRLANGGLGHTRVTIIYAVASLAGAVAAHMDVYESATSWSIGFVVLTMILGVVLDVHAKRVASAAHV